jgi:hypothetical protein
MELVSYLVGQLVSYVLREGEHYYRADCRSGRLVFWRCFVRMLAGRPTS